VAGEEEGGQMSGNINELEKTNAELVQRMKEDGEYICTLSERCLQYHEAVLKYKEEIKGLTEKIEQLYAGSEEQGRTIRELEEVNEYLRQKNDKLEYGRTNE
jgi:chromosome segregation ATPase